MEVQFLDPESICDAADARLKRGAPLLAYDILADGLARFPDHVRMRQLLALALARSGASGLANPLLQRLVNEGCADEETVGLLARTHKDLSAESTDEAERRFHLELALQHYRRAYEQTAGYWSGINAATTALLLGHDADASAIAGRVHTQCRARATETAAEDAYWVLATLGEAALLLGNDAEAAEWYTRARALGRTRIADVAATRRNARLILRHCGVDASRFDACFGIGPVAVFAGHLIDRPDRREPRFPAALEPAVAAAIRERVRAIAPGFAYASAACGSDILFLEAADAVGAELHIVLPYNRVQFRDDSVSIGGGEWAVRYERVLERAAEVTVASEHRIGSGAPSYEYAFRLLDGQAGIKADELDTEVTCLAVWDGMPGDGRGGTAAAIEHWRRQGRLVDHIDLAGLLPPHVGIPQPIREPTVAEAREFDAQVVGLLFADARGFSRLSEEEMPLFVREFLGGVADELSRARRAPRLANTWGDGVYLVFDDVTATGEFALRLRERVRGTDWRAKGFRADLSVRIGLHAGPAYACLDPVTARRNYFGVHVSRAARIEPIAPPGEVYASGAFAALARADGAGGFACAYVGQTPLAKGYGTFPTYVVRRRGA